MIYKFKSKAAGDVIMLGPQGDQLLRLAGREPSRQGIFEVADMPALLSAWQAAIADDEAQASPPADEQPTPVALRQRLWPLMELLRRAHQAEQPVVWGV
jgi:hypothetical protein